MSVAHADQIPVSDPHREAWLRVRRTGIGASEVAAVLGVHPYLSAYTLWHEKRGLLPPLEESEAMEWGKLLEPVIADKYARVTGRKLVDHGRYQALRSSRWPFLIATLDREVAPVDGRKGPGALEIKTTGTFVEPKWKDEPPLYVQTQMQAQLAVTGWSWGSFAVLVGGQKYDHLDMNRDDDFIGILVEKCEAFWRLVQDGTPPPVDGSDSTADTLAALHPDDNGDVVHLAAEQADWLRIREEAKAAIKREEAREQEASNHLRAAIGSATFGAMPDGRLLSLKTTERAGYVVEPKKFRQLRVSKAAKGRP